MRADTRKRLLLTVSLGARTKDRIDAIALGTGLPRGRVIDMAIAMVETCSECDGAGSYGLAGELERICTHCHGHRLIGTS